VFRAGDGRDLRLLTDRAEDLRQIAGLYWFGLGFGIPLVVLSLLSGGLYTQLTRCFAVHARAVNLAGGILLIGPAAYDFAMNWEVIRLSLLGF
jgi:cytochrome c-type biogenesis protein